MPHPGALTHSHATLSAPRQVRSPPRAHATRTFAPLPLRHADLRSAFSLIYYQRGRTSSGCLCAVCPCTATACLVSPVLLAIGPLPLSSIFLVGRVRSRPARGHLSGLRPLGSDLGLSADSHLGTVRLHRLHREDGNDDDDDDDANDDGDDHASVVVLARRRRRRHGDGRD